MIYFIVDKNGKRGHPTRKGHMVTRKFKNGTAKMISRTKDTLTVKLLDKEFKDEDTVDAEFRIGIDPGAKNIGVALYKIFNNTITLLISGEAEIRSTEVAKNLTERKIYRNVRRQNRRKNVKRKFNSVKFRKPVWENRKSKPFRPTHVHLIRSHANLVNWFAKRCPINKVHIEYTKFDTQKMNNPGIHSWQYQHGESYGFENVKSYVRSRDGYVCQACKKKSDMLHVHHIISRGIGSNKPSNLIIVCLKCHGKIHTGEIKCPSIKNNNLGLRQTGILNSCMPKLFSIFENKVPTQNTYGYITKTIRLNSGLEKSHRQDAQIIALSDSLELQDINDYNYVDLDNDLNVKQHRRHNRAWTQRLKSRKYYITSKGKKIFAYNRSRAYGQTKKDHRGLDELRKELKNRGALNKVQIYAEPGGPTYFRGNTKRQFKPGDLINYNGVIDVCKGWASTQFKVILENHGYVKQKLCQVIRKNNGMVFV